jgi:hypothetical protein
MDDPLSCFLHWSFVYLANAKQEWIKVIHRAGTGLGGRVLDSLCFLAVEKNWGQDQQLQGVLCQGIYIRPACGCWRFVSFSHAQESTPTKLL